MEYNNMASTYQLDEDDMQQESPMPEDPENGMNQGMGAPEGGMEPGMDSMDPGMNPGMEDMNPNMDGNMDPNMGVDGFNPSGVQNNMDTMPDDSMPTNGEAMQPDDEVIDVDDLTKSQEAAENKIDKMNAKFEKLMGAVETLIKQNAERDAKAAEAESRLRAELEKRIPTPQQKMTMRSTKSAPYAMTPNEYMNNYAPENYSEEDDNNGENDAQYKITKDDIDRFTDYNSIIRDLDIEHQGLHDILGM